MCGRYAFFSPAEAVKRVFGVDSLPELHPRYNIAPTQAVPVLRQGQDGRREVVLLHWGLVPSWAKEKSIGQRMINARSETLAERPAFRRAFRDRRCLVLADGWYEWQPSPAGKQPWFIRRRDGAVLGLAGLWERWRDPGGETLESCTIVTTDAVGELARIHNRTPAVIASGEAEHWLDPRDRDVAAQSRLLGPVDPGEYQAFRVSRQVNEPRHEGAALIDAAGED